MKYTIGAYSLDVDKPFDGIDEAVQFVKERHPELSREEIEDNLKPKVRKNGNDNGSGAGKETEESGKANSQSGKRRPEAGQNGENKPK